MNKNLRHSFRLRAIFRPFVFQRIEDTPEGQIQRELRRTNESQQDAEVTGRDVVASQLESLFVRSLYERYPNSRVENILYVGKDTRGQDIFSADLRPRNPTDIYGRDVFSRERITTILNGLFLANGNIKPEDEFEGVGDPSPDLIRAAEENQNRNAIQLLGYFRKSDIASTTIRQILYNNNILDTGLAPLRALGKLSRNLLEQFARSSRHELQFQASIVWAEICINFDSSQTFMDIFSILSPSEKMAIMQAYYETNPSHSLENQTTAWYLLTFDNNPFEESFRATIAREIMRRPWNEINSTYFQRVVENPTIRTRLSEPIDWIFNSNFFGILHNEIETGFPELVLSCVNVCSIAITVERLIGDEKYEPGRLAAAIRDILIGREVFSEHEIFSPNTHVILVAHEPEDDRPFGNERYANIARRSGVPQNHIEQFQGPNQKRAILEHIRRSQGKTTLVFNGHGGNSTLCLSNNVKINIDEFTDALIASGNTRNITIILSACLNYNFARNLVERLQARHIPIPIIISSVSKDRLGFGEVLINNLEEMISSRERGTPLRGETFLELETYTFTYLREEPDDTGHDLGFFISTDESPTLELGTCYSSWIEVS